MWVVLVPPFAPYVDPPHVRLVVVPVRDGPDMYAFLMFDGYCEVERLPLPFHSLPGMGWMPTSGVQ